MVLCGAGGVLEKGDVGPIPERLFTVQVAAVLMRFARG
jgi:hypothetical protein